MWCKFAHKLAKGRVDRREVRWADAVPAVILRLACANYIKFTQNHLFICVEWNRYHGYSISAPFVDVSMSMVPSPDSPFHVPSEGQRSLNNPFSADVCSGPYGVEETRSVPGLNLDVLERLTEAVDQRQRQSGQSGGSPLVLLTAPRAGYGKTHLLGRMTVGGIRNWLVVPLAFRMNDEVTRSNVALRGLEALERADAGPHGWSQLREACGGVVNAIIRHLIESGKLPCANPQQAMQILAGPANEVFDSCGQARLIGDWLGKHLSPLRRPMAEWVAKTTGALTVEAAEPWVDAMVGQAMEGQGVGVAALRQLVSHDEESGTIWLKMLQMWRPVVLLVDHLDGFYRNAEAGLKIAAQLLDLAELDGYHVVLSLNQDVWQATFGHHLPSALEDRLTASRLLLRGLTEHEAAEMVHLRLGEAGVESSQATQFTKFLDVHRYFMGRPLGSVSARAFLRHAAQQWTAFTHSVPSPEEAGNSSDFDWMPLVKPPVASSGEATIQSPFRLSETPIFDPGTNEYLRRVAGGLSEPVAALPQNELVPAEEPIEATELIEESAGSGGDGPVQGQEERFSVTNMARLKEMLEELRHGNGVDQPNPPQPMMAGISSEHAAESEPTARAALKGRFDTLRAGLESDVKNSSLDGVRIEELLRLAGRRFPLVRFSDHELPGQPGRMVIGWSLSGSEILFAPIGEVDRNFWQVFSTFAAGRLAVLQEQAAAAGETPSDFKVVVFKAGSESDTWGKFLSGAGVPEALVPWLDVIHLDDRSVAALYAMHRIIREAETGELHVTPQQVMSVLARELDFFWKRITRHRVAN